MVHAATTLRLAKIITSSTGGGTEKALYTPRALYKYLFRKCDKLPNKEVQLYYRHHIRQSYNQHADETDPERVSQIINQAAKDIDWVLKKFLTMEALVQDILEMEGDADVSQDVGDNSAISIEAPISGPIKFFQALSTFCSRPELLVPQARSTDVDWRSIESDLKKCYKDLKCETLFDFLYSPVYHEGKCVTSSNIGEFSGSLQETTIQSLMKPDSKMDSVKIQRDVHHKPTKGWRLGWSSTILEHWDFRNFVVEVISEFQYRPLPYTPLMSFTATYSAEDNVARITTPVSSYVDDETSSNIEFYKTIVFPRLLGWMSDHYKVEPPKLTRLRARPLTYICNKRYWLYYDKLKSGPAKIVKQIWQESTDPVKFIHEDVGIAAYIASFIYGGRNNSHTKLNNIHNVEVLDLGCGNGLLCFFLSHILASNSAQSTVVGFDIRKRRIWQDLLNQPRPKRNTTSRVPGDEVSHADFKLIERSFVPHLMDDLINRYGCTKEERLQKSLWIIGNHSDELTPWIPIVARRLNATGFFIIPCCPYDFFKKYQRHGNLPGSSIYQNYIEYVCKIGDEYGYQPMLDKLRIPSTKNICLVGLDCSHKFDTNVISDRVENMLKQLSEGDEGSSILKFVPRAVESAKENPKVDTKIAKDIVDKIFLLLIKDWENEPKSAWYAGCDTLTFNEIMSSLTTDEREILRGKGNGVRTLIKSNKHLFTINGNFVKLRIPNESDLENVSETGRDRLKTRVCHFFANHPQGCPLASELCTFKHEM